MRALGLALVLALFAQAEVHVAPEPAHFRYTRTVTVAQGPGRAACAVLDGAVYAHSQSLADLRLWSDGHELPYALSTSLTAPGYDQAKVLNVGTRGGRVVFDLEMPGRAYTDVRLDLDASDFVATARVTGLKDSTDKNGVALGDYTLYDLAGQRLGRSTTLKLQESTFPFLRVELAFTGVNGAAFQAEAGTITGASVPPSREAQTLYTLVGRTTAIVQRGRQTVATLELPARVPVERVSVELAPGDKTNFSRSVTVTAKTQPKPKTDEVEPAGVETVTGEISQIKLTQAGREIREESLGFPATLGANVERPATVEVAVENGDDRPAPITAVRLEMRQRKVCFDVPAAPLTMYYGDAALTAPVYDYARVYDASAPAREAGLGAEIANPGYVPRAQDVVRKTFAERHPAVLWVALLGVVAVLGLVAFRSAKKV